ncbi:UNVERIFIED_CONTAM: hypothetical protein HDU68_008978 [Siphonaria sp. JEL0065]|nr:hypothetical protein HDU68_008978 [Siphonaria sp. JEL0065]
MSLRNQALKPLNLLLSLPREIHDLIIKALGINVNSIFRYCAVVPILRYICHSMFEAASLMRPTSKYNIWPIFRFHNSHLKRLQEMTPDEKQKIKEWSSILSHYGKTGIVTIGELGLPIAELLSLLPNKLVVEIHSWDARDLAGFAAVAEAGGHLTIWFNRFGTGYQAFTPEECAFLAHDFLKIRAKSIADPPSGFWHLLPQCTNLDRLNLAGNWRERAIPLQVVAQIPSLRVLAVEDNFELLKDLVEELLKIIGDSSITRLDLHASFDVRHLGLFPLQVTMMESFIERFQAIGFTLAPVEGRTTTWIRKKV